MPTVSDTSPILGMAIIGHLELLHEQFGAVFIPQAVLEELKIETEFRGDFWALRPQTHSSILSFGRIKS